MGRRRKEKKVRKPELPVKREQEVEGNSGGHQQGISKTSFGGGGSKFGEFM